MNLLELLHWQTLHVIFFKLGGSLSNRFPQSVQKSRVPTKAMTLMLVVEVNGASKNIIF